MVLIKGKFYLLNILKIKLNSIINSMKSINRDVINETKFAKALNCCKSAADLGVKKHQAHVFWCLI